MRTEASAVADSTMVVTSTNPRIAKRTVVMFTLQPNGLGLREMLDALDRKWSG
jgi:hypothetical protein